MISRRKLPELQNFARAESTFPFFSKPEYGRLVVPNGNDKLPVHRWFRYKEAFSADLLEHVLQNIDLGLKDASPIRLLDPFCGVGTSLISSQLLPSARSPVIATGIECNPFSAFVARTKASWPQIDSRLIRALAAETLSRRTKKRSVSVPGLSSIKSGKCIARYTTHQILQIRDTLLSVDPSPERDVLMVGLAAAIEPASRIRRDGRALRIVTKQRTVLKRLLATRWASMAQDIDELRKSRPNAFTSKVVLGDGRALNNVEVGAGAIDLVLTSPPYPNNIDYNEVYKLELWLLGFVSSADEFLGLRKGTFRSHPTCSSLGNDVDENEQLDQLLEDGAISDLLGMVIRRVRSLDKAQGRGRTRVLLGYISDTWRSMKAHHSLLRKGGRAIYVVGNSLHGAAERPYLVPTDLILASIGRSLGFKVQELIVARPLQRRLAGNHFLRDSVLVLRKP